MRHYTVLIQDGKRIYHVQTWFTWVEGRALELLQEALEQKDEKVKNHNILYAYRVYLDSGPCPPLPRHRYMYDHLPNHPADATEKD